MYLKCTLRYTGSKLARSMRSVAMLLRYPAAFGLSAYIYDTRNLGQVIHDLFGNVSWWHIYVGCIERSVCPFLPLNVDREFPDQFLAKSLRESVHLDIATHPSQADVLVWAVCDFTLCSAVDAERPMRDWQSMKGVRVSSCSTHLRLLRWMRGRSRWRALGGRDHVMLMSSHMHWASETFVASFRTPATAAAIAELNEMAAATFLSPEANDAEFGAVIVVPYFVNASVYRAPPGAHRPYLASFAGTVHVRDLCRRCFQRANVTSATLRRALAATLVKCGAKCKFEPLRGIDRNNQTSILGRGIALVLQRSEYCFAPRGDTGSTKRFYAAVAAGCTPIILSDTFVPAFNVPALRVAESIIVGNKSNVEDLLSSAIAEGKRLGYNGSSHSSRFLYNEPGLPTERSIWRQIELSMVRRVFTLHTGAVADKVMDRLVGGGTRGAPTKHSAIGYHGT